MRTAARWSRLTRFVRGAVPWFLVGLAVSLALPWGLALTHPLMTQTASATAARDDERLSVSTYKGFGASNVEMVREFGANWAPFRAAGPPDTTRMGDLPTAWASLTPDSQMEWIELDYENPVVPSEIRVYETNAPGALVRASVFDASGQEISAWSGADPAAPNPQGIFVATLPVHAGIATSRIRLELNSPRVAGWNEIDAVGLVDQQGNMQWATDVRASSTYATNPSPGVSGDLTALRDIAPRWLPVGWQTPAGKSPVPESRTFEARGWPLPVLWGEKRAGAFIQPLELRWPVWHALALDAAFYAVGLYLLYQCTFGTRRFVRESLRLRRGQCMRCGYDLRFDLAAGCPECGWRRHV
jgi:hypothetical protein